MTELTELSDRLHADPYANSQRLRRHFRQEKKVENGLLQQDADLKQKYGLGERLRLDRPDSAVQEREKQMWERVNQSKTSKAIVATSVPDLAKVVKANTQKRYNPFDRDIGSIELVKVGPSKGSSLGIKPKGKGKGRARTVDDESIPPQPTAKRRRRSQNESDEDEAHIDSQLETHDDRKQSLREVVHQPSSEESPGSLPPTDVEASKRTKLSAVNNLKSGLLDYGSDDQSDIDEAIQRD
jgi:hypothetical protein